MRNGTPHLSSSLRALTMLDSVINGGGGRSITDLARQLDIPVSTAHRQIATLVAAGYLSPDPGGGYMAGSRLLLLNARIDEKQVIVSKAAPVLPGLARQIGCIVQLGTLENDMVTYRLKAGRSADALFTKVGQQLEAYCSGMGKVLLANLPEDEREKYLALGPFVPLTPATITDPDHLRSTLRQIAMTDVAQDEGEIVPDLHCVAVPIKRPDGKVLAAISASYRVTEGETPGRSDLIAPLTAAAMTISAQVYGDPSDTVG
ncbi:IclR family transcriptional regulator [Niveispirillum sp.]|uniref:IclR family transcriptional regulator n=1 Tax=Niveispirillum sp. TaxID=1917217 RepID=UPI004036B7B3